MNKKENKVLYILLSLAISFGLWIYVVMVENPEYEETFHDIPVVMSNESGLADRGLMYIADDVPTVTLRLSGTRSHMNKLSSSNITLIADLSKIYDAGEQQLSYSILFPGDIPPNSISVQSQAPSQITVNIVERKSKQVDIKVNYVGSVPEDYIADKDNVKLDHDAVTVTGPASIIDQISYAQITVDLQDVTDDISRSYQFTLCNSAGETVNAERVTASVSEVQLGLSIQQVKEVELLLDVIYGGGATEETTTIVIDPLTIKVSGPKKLLEDLDSITIGSVDLAELLEDQVLTFLISDSLPEGLTNLTGEDEVTVTIDIPVLVTKVLRINYFRPVNVPSGMSVSFITKILEVTVRGTQDQINLITADDLSVRVDFSNAETGDGLYKPDVTISPQFDTVGVVEVNNIYATVTGGGN